MDISHLIRQKGYEKIEFLLRRHPLTFVPIVVLFLVLMAVPAVIYFLIDNLFPNLWQGQLLFPLGTLAASVYYLSVYLFFYAHFIDFYLDIWIVTNDRVVDIEQHGLFARTISEMDLYRIQDVTVEVKGFFPTLLKYGHLKVKAASPNVSIFFQNIPRPNALRQAILHLSDEDRRHHHGASD